MSRCFPFPPPGYEKKARIDDPDLLAKEKHKEKKHKKKDKEKREGKEKKDKDRPKDKHREKKDRKEKHKERDWERDTEKNQSSDAKGTELQTGLCNGEKLDPNSVHSSEIKDSKHKQELARRIRDQDGASGSQMVPSRSQMFPNVAATDVRRAKMPGMASESNVVRKLEKFNVKDQKEDHRKENGQGNRVFARGMETLSVQVSSSLEQKQVEPIAKPLGKEEADKQMERKEEKRHKEKEGKGEKEKQKDRDQGKDKDSKDKDRDKVKKTEEKSKENRDSSKEPLKWKETNHKLEQSTSEPIDLRNINPLDPSKLGCTSITNDRNPSKRKEHEKNGYMLDDSNRPNKFAKLSFHQPVIENGRKLEPRQTVIQFGQNGASLKHNGVEIKESKINGFITPQRPYESLAKPPLTGVARKENGEASAKVKPPHPDANCLTDVMRNENGAASAKVKPPHPDAKHPTDITRNENGEASARVKQPHPDAKYLSQILAVPTMEDLHGSLDEEWLFGGNHLPLKKLNTGSSPVDCTQQVWSEAVRIESADISALPYVLPY